MTTVPAPTAGTPIDPGSGTTPVPQPSPPALEPAVVQKITIGFNNGGVHVFKGQPKQTPQPAAVEWEDGSIRVVISETADIVFTKGTVAWYMTETVLDDGKEGHSTEAAAVVKASTSDNDSTPSTPHEDQTSTPQEGSPTNNTDPTVAETTA